MADNSTPNRPPTRYRDAGVDIDAGNRLVDRIKPLAGATRRDGVLSGLGGFGGLFELPAGRYERPVLVAGTDGVGTKVRLAIELGRHQTIGIDLVAMCVNDVLVTGAEPLFFLDYYATARLDVEIASAVVGGIAEGCKQAGCALLGGETAEMPGMYAAGDYDLAGFCVGVVEHGRLLGPERVQAGDTLIALASTGPHSNGYSLIRRLIEIAGADLAMPLDDGHTLGAALMEPTAIYVEALLPEIAAGRVHAMAHITGGGLTENVPRMLPAGTRAWIDLASLAPPAVFAWLREQGNVPEDEMLRTFNCGVGMVLAVAPADAAGLCERLAAGGRAAWPLGRVEATDDESMVRYGGTLAL